MPLKTGFTVIQYIHELSQPQITEQHMPSRGTHAHTRERATVMQSCIHAPQRDVWKTRITCDNKSDITHNSPRPQIHVNNRIITLEQTEITATGLGLKYIQLGPELQCLLRVKEDLS